MYGKSCSAIVSKMEKTAGQLDTNLEALSLTRLLYRYYIKIHTIGKSSENVVVIMPSMNFLILIHGGTEKNAPEVLHITKRCVKDCKYFQGITKNRKQ